MANPRTETYMPDKPCVHGHFAPRYFNTRRCVECEQEYYKKRYEKVRAIQKQKKVKEANTYMPTERCVNGHLAPRYIATRACTVCAKEADKKWHAKNMKARRMEKEESVESENTTTKDELLQMAGLSRKETGRILPEAILQAPEITPKQYTKYMQLMIFKTTVATELMYYASLGGYDTGKLARNIIAAFDREDAWWDGKQNMVLGELIKEFMKDPVTHERSSYRSDAAGTSFVLSSSIGGSRVARMVG